MPASFVYAKLLILRKDLRSIQCYKEIKLINIVFTETDAQKFKAKFEECRNEVDKRAKKGKVKS